MAAQPESGPRQAASRGPRTETALRGMVHMERRDVLKMGALGALAAGGLAVPIGVTAGAKSASLLADRNKPRPYQAAFRRPPVLKPYETVRDAKGLPVLQRYSITAEPFQASIVPGLTTTMWGYNKVFPGPTISVDQNVRVEMRVRNKLPLLPAETTFGQPSDTSTHLHGSASFPQFDGYANDVTKAGFVKT